jgi:transposase
VAIRVGIKNKIHAVLTKNGIDCTFSDVLGKSSQLWLKSLAVRACYRQEIDGYLRIAEALGISIAEITTKIKAEVAESPQAQLLMSIPGISYYSALLVLSEIGEIERFPDAKRLCSYAGLVPSIYSSGSKTYHGRITKQGSRWLRWILVEASTHAANGDANIQKLYRRVSRRRGRSTARVAVARKILTIIYAMLKRNEPFKRQRPRQRLVGVPGGKKVTDVSGHPGGVMVPA